MGKRVDALETYWFINMPELSEPDSEELMVRLRNTHSYAFAQFQDALEEAFESIIGKHLRKLLK